MKEREGKEGVNARIFFFFKARLILRPMVEFETLSRSLVVGDDGRRLAKLVTATRVKKVSSVAPG